MTDPAQTPTPAPPANIIHSVPQPAPVPPLASLPQSSADTPSPRSKALAIFSPRERNADSPDKPPTPFRRIFSPATYRRSPTSIANQQRESDSTGPILSPPRKRRFVSTFLSCFSRSSNDDDSLQELDYGQHLKSLEPTYEPESPLLPTPFPHAQDRICLVLDLDETLVHSSFSPIDSADFQIPLEMQGEVHTVYVKKRPGVDDFLKKASQWYEIVVFTASLALYANPVMDLLDPHNLVQLRLYREHCVLIGGCYVKDIAKLGRDLKRTFIIDNSPLSYILQPENAIPISAFFTDENDRELDKTLALLEQAKNMKDVRKAFS